jgi:hypothetical protein
VVFFWCQDWLSFKRLRTPSRGEKACCNLLDQRVCPSTNACPYDAFLLLELLPVDIAQPTNRNSPTIVDHDNRRLGVSHPDRPIHGPQG